MTVRQVNRSKQRRLIVVAFVAFVCLMVFTFAMFGFRGEGMMLRHLTTGMMDLPKDDSMDAPTRADDDDEKIDENPLPSAIGLQDILQADSCVLAIRDRGDESVAIARVGRTAPDTPRRTPDLRDQQGT